MHCPQQQTVNINIYPDLILFMCSIQSLKANNTMRLLNPKQKPSIAMELEKEAKRQKMVTNMINKINPVN